MTAKLSLPKSAELLALAEKAVRPPWRVFRTETEISVWGGTWEGSDYSLFRVTGGGGATMEFVGTAHDLAAQHRLALEVLQEMAEALRFIHTGLGPNVGGVVITRDDVLYAAAEALSLIGELA